MKNILFIFLIFLAIQVAGNEIPEDLPKVVSRTLNSIFGKEKVNLNKVDFCEQGFPGDKLFVIHTEKNMELVGYLHLGRVKTCRAGGCSAPGEVKAGEDSEYFDYLIVFKPDFSVERVLVINYQASYGHEIAAKGWLKQFQGFTGKTSLEVGKNIDAISGATVSVRAITEDVQWKTKLVQEVVQH